MPASYQKPRITGENTTNLTHSTSVFCFHQLHPIVLWCFLSTLIYYHASLLPEAKHSPPGENATEKTVYMCLMNSYASFASISYQSMLFKLDSVKSAHVILTLLI